MKVLVACEESQAVTIAFRNKGHEAYSCDLVDCSGGHPEWHIKCDVVDVLFGGAFVLGNDVAKDEVIINKWDLVVAHPPCTFMANSGVRWLFNKDGKRNALRWASLYRSLVFWNEFIKYQEYTGVKMAIENPIPHKYAKNSVDGWPKGIGMYDQIIHPWQFGHLETKSTCLWLRGVPPLTPTDNVYDEMMKLSYGERAKVHHASPGPERAKLRSKTYKGIAEAMASQWGQLTEIKAL